MKSIKKFMRLFTQLISSIQISLSTSTTKRQVYKEIIIIAVTVQLILEMLSHRSVIHGLLTTINNPLMFICSILLISTFLSFSLFLPKRHLGYTLISTLWLWLGFTNFILLSHRTTPLTATDFKMLTSVFTVIKRYLSSFQMVAVLLFACLVILSLCYIATKLPYTKIKLRLAFVTSTLYILLLVASFNIALSANAVSRNFGNIADAYIDYGFAYSFSTSVVDKGIQRPKSYSSEKIGTVLDILAKESDHVSDATVAPSSDETDYSKDLFDPEIIQLSEPRPNTTPNIIIIQLESFFDVKRLKSLDYTIDPTPNISYLQENFSSGFVMVPSIGAGTVNTEFEILCGMSLDYFGAGEYPYKTILKETTVQSMPYDLAELGYQSHALHNNMGTFYARHNVYPNLGFNTFTSIEYMDDVTYNPLEWANDKVLVPEIIKALDSTQTQDFVFAVSVQPHGKYPEEAILDNPVIVPTVVSDVPDMINNDHVPESQLNVDPQSDHNRLVQDKLLTNQEDSFKALLDNAQIGANDMSDITHSQSETLELAIDQAIYNKYLYYVNQVYETDAFVGQLIQALETYPEPVIVVFYGDHLPTLDIEQEDLSNGSPYQMDYAIWDNMGLDKVKEHLPAYQMSSMIMDRLGYQTGLLNKFHLTMKDTPAYQDELQLLQYDMLYGDRNVYGNINPYQRTKMKMGIEPITISDVYTLGEALFVKGSNFTPFSEVYINKIKVETLYIDRTTLIVPNQDVTQGMAIKISQVTVTGKKLSSTSTYVVE